MILMIIVFFFPTNKTVIAKQSNRCGVSMRKKRVELNDTFPID
jgi:hypothetical protein